VGSVFAQSAITELEMRYRTRNFSLVASVMAVSFRMAGWFKITF
jgi:hypothetical protein